MPNTLTKPDTMLFEEYFIMFNDIDAAEEYSATTWLSQAQSDAEMVAWKKVKREHSWMFGGNCLELDVVEKTGATKTGVLNPVTGRYRLPVELTTQRTETIDEDSSHYLGSESAI